MPSDSIVIVGAGIIGLDVALVLARRGLGKSVTVVAEYLPGDTAPSYTSPWAGCNFSGISGSDKNALRWDKIGYAHLTALASKNSQASFVSRSRSTEYWDTNPPHEKLAAISQYMEDFRALSPTELPDGVEHGMTCTTLTLNAPKHLQYLYTLLQDAGVRFIRRKIAHIHDAYAPATQIVFNCTGNAARTLPGVQDEKCYPTRGQVVLVKAPRMKNNVMRHGKDYETYVIPRPQSNGNVVLGGFMQKNNSDPATYGDQTASIITRSRTLCPELADAEIIAAFAGLRPSREGGARVEREEVSVSGKSRILVHNYGAGGTGFQAGYGMATDAVHTVDDVLEKVVSKL